MSQRVKQLFPTQVEAERYLAEITSLRLQIEALREHHTNDLAERHKQYETNANHYKDRIHELQEKVIEYRDRLIEIEQRFIIVLERKDNEWIEWMKKERMNESK